MSDEKKEINKETEEKATSPLVKQEIRNRPTGFSEKKTSRKHQGPKTSRNPKGFS